MLTARGPEALLNRLASAGQPIDCRGNPNAVNSLTIPANTGLTAVGRQNFYKNLKEYCDTRGGATHGGKMYVENLRGHLRFFAKHHGLRSAERVRLLLLWSLRVRALVLRRPSDREGVRFLSSGKAATLLS